jgi:drug/metabolite transporter (DMT)-like permease
MFGETIDQYVVIGTVMVIGGVALVNSRLGERRIFGRRPAANDASSEPAA